MTDALINEIDLDGYQVVRSQYFEKQTEPMLTLFRTAIAFGQSAFQALNNCEAIQVLLSNHDKSIVIRPVPSNTPDAVLWKKRAEPTYTKIECPRLTRNIYERWGLDKKCHYRTVGKTVQADRKLLILFDFTDPIVYEGLKRV